MSNNTILIVDDDPEILAFYRKLFAPATSSEFDVLASPDQEQAGLECLTYSDPLQLLEYYRISVADGRQHPLCIVDMRMPILNGLATATRLREIDPDIDIVICTAFSDVPVEKIRAQIKSGIFIVRKPFVTDEFILLVQSSQKSRENPNRTLQPHRPPRQPLGIHSRPGIHEERGWRLPELQSSLQRICRSS